MPLIAADEWLEAAAHRRSVHGLEGTSKLSDDRVKDIVSKVVSFAPSAYNTQPVRVSLAFGDKHKALWTIILREAELALTAINPALWEKLGPVFQTHKAAYGSILFWEHGKTQREAAATHKATAHMFREWGDQAQGIYQILIWTALELEGVGANLQHMDVLEPIEAAIKEWAGVPEDYKLKGHLNYGDEQGPHPEKPKRLAVEEVLVVL